MKANTNAKKYFKISFFFYLVLQLISCKGNMHNDLHNGDLIFISAKQEGLSGAINNVTQQQDNANFDHIGIVEKEGRHYYVLHAAPRGGSQKQTLQAFIKDQHQNQQQMVIYRLKSNFQTAIPKAIIQANAMLGKPYNFDYILADDSYYCSDFIERAFRENHIFRLEPMTFIDPKTGVTNTFWKDFYDKKNIEVPEGKPGCNPNGLAASDKLERIKILD